MFQPQIITSDAITLASTSISLTFFLLNSRQSQPISTLDPYRQKSLKIPLPQLQSGNLELFLHYGGSFFRKVVFVRFVIPDRSL
jgi:hypothetical protein